MFGLGFANIGGLLTAEGHSYDSDEGRATAVYFGNHDRYSLCYIG